MADHSHWLNPDRMREQARRKRWHAKALRTDAATLERQADQLEQDAAAADRLTQANANG